ncbi:MAG: Ava_C0101 and related proteins [uncultured Nocardioidaceae bacterium]|uniref:Ava_C0101 and related proteins n=1 Tax=uncultured Nocardioidaceae bacterium TaxID=253824 RepID=A0A6J4LWB2_9ACTN|nr:MAG: Ava_C0101 and related proteins [uncultured Nocardioidaceae bacterium]
MYLSRRRQVDTHEFGSDRACRGVPAACLGAGVDRVREDGDVSVEDNGADDDPLGGAPHATGWPVLSGPGWQETRDTLHMWTQVVGKVRMAVEPPLNHWWHVPLYVSSRGLTTSLVHHPVTPFEITFDFRAHRLSVDLVDGQAMHVALFPRSVADFYAEVMAALGQLGLDVVINPRPVEVVEAIPFHEDTLHASYDADRAQAFWLALVQTQRVLRRFAAGFAGKNSPVHFFWGSFDLAQTRFSGRPAPRHPGGVPNCPDSVMEEAYSHEVSSCGYWPGGESEGLFYAYAYPVPEGYRSRPVSPAAAGYDDALGEFVLPYADVRRSAAPDPDLLGFFQSAYDAAADLGGWDPALVTGADLTATPGT